MAPFPHLKGGALTLLALWAVVALAACDRKQPAHDVELEHKTQALLTRVERMERQGVQDRERLDEEMRALREDVNALSLSLDAASQHLAALSGQGASQNATAQPLQANKSPRAALRQSLSEALESSRQALERLTKSLDKSLAWPKGATAPAEPAK